MKTYCFTVIGNPSYFRSVYIRSKNLKGALSSLQELLSREFCGEYRISQFYTLISSGKKSFRSMSKVIRGVA